MSRRDAPLYVHCHDFARDLLPRVESGGHPVLRGAIATESIELLGAVSEALAFPGEARAQALRSADRHVARLKVLLRLALDLGVVGEAGAHHAGARLVEIGRMVGGWRKRHPGPPSTPTPRGSAAPPPGA